MKPPKTGLRAEAFPLGRERLRRDVPATLEGRRCQRRTDGPHRHGRDHHAERSSARGRDPRKFAGLDGPQRVSPKRSRPTRTEWPIAPMTHRPLQPITTSTAASWAACSRSRLRASWPLRRASRRRRSVGFSVRFVRQWPGSVYRKTAARRVAKSSTPGTEPWHHDGHHANGGGEGQQPDEDPDREPCTMMLSVGAARGEQPERQLDDEEHDHDGCGELDANQEHEASPPGHEAGQRGSTPQKPIGSAGTTSRGRAGSRGGRSRERR